MAQNDQVKLALDNGVICNIGQVTPAEKRALEKLVRSGELVKWRGYWHPVSGANFGIGPLKTCYGTPTYHENISALCAGIAARNSTNTVPA